MSNYWANRKAKLMVKQMQTAEDTSELINQVYLKSSMYLNRQIQGIFKRYKTKHHISDKQAYALLNSVTSKETLQELILELKKGIPSEEKKELIKILEAPVYRYRINQLEELQNQIDVMMKEVYKQEKEIQTTHYINLSYDGYYQSIYEIQKRSGLAFSFSQIDPNMIDKLLHSNWSGKNYSNRIWGNTQILAKTLKEEILISYLTGKTEREVATELSNKFNVGMYQSRRLVRTESNFISGEMDSLAYKESNISKYMFVATLDLRTSKKCRELDGKVFKVSEEKIGVNKNPMHPFCRSTTIAYFGKEWLKSKERKGLNLKEGKIDSFPADMTYEEWLKKQQNENGFDTVEVLQKKIKNKRNDLKQYDRYKKVLGDDFEFKTLDEFQNMKYNDVEKYEKIKTKVKDLKLQSRIINGDYNLVLREGQQGKHILGHNNYITGRSYIVASMEQIQECINKNAGKGHIERTRLGEWKNQELITDENITGYVIDLHGNVIATNRFKIHYSKEKGTHLVPTLKR